MKQGILKRWNDEKGFGFIQLENSNEDVFLHISSLQNSARRPTVGDTVYFNIETDQAGRKRAANASIQGVMSVFTEKATTSVSAHNLRKTSSKTNSYHARGRVPKKTNNGRIVSKVFNVAILLAAIFFIHKFYKENQILKSSPISSVLESDTESLASASQFQCSGKTRCSQMTSCDEAMFYLKNCPGSVMDGDGDGLPCEDQWCGH